MALFFKTDNPEKLLKEFKLAVAEGRVSSWICDADGDFTLTLELWKNKAWLKPKIEIGGLTLNLIRPKKANITSQVYAAFHGRFIQTMLIHCDELFSECLASALPKGKDDVSGE